MVRAHTSRTLSPTRRALLGAGVATLAMSLALSIAPAWAKSASSGTVKIHDASGSDAADSSNDPHVCAFVILFDYDPPTSGAWQILSWAPTGDGSQVAGGSWSAIPGTNQTDSMTLPAGHYKLDYQADGDSNPKHKTFWVDESCDNTGGPAGSNQPSNTPNGSPSDVPNDSPSDAPSDQPSDSPSDAPSDSPSDQPSDAPSESPSDAPSDQPSDSPSDAPSESPSDAPSDQPSDSPTESPSGSPEGDVQGETGGDQGGTGGSPSGVPAPTAQPSDNGGGTQGVTSPSGGGDPTLPDTAVTPPSVLSPLLAALGLLLIIAAHPFIRRSALADRA